MRDALKKKPRFFNETVFLKKNIRQFCKALHPGFTQLPGAIWTFAFNSLYNLENLAKSCKSLQKVRKMVANQGNKT